MIVQDEIVQVANEAGQMYWEEVEVSIQSDGGLQEYVDKAISKKKEELFNMFAKAQAVANPAHSLGFLEQVSVEINCNRCTLSSGSVMCVVRIEP